MKKQFLALTSAAAIISGSSFCARIYGKRQSKSKATRMIGELNENNSD